MAIPILSAIGKLFGPVTNLVDEIITSDEERLVFNERLEVVRNGAAKVLLEHEASIIASQRDVIIAEAQAESWITRSWRPITMLSFVVLIFLTAVGIADVVALQQVPDRLWDLMKLGLGGYMLTRSGEKMVKDAAAAYKAKEEA